MLTPRPPHEGYWARVWVETWDREKALQFLWECFVCLCALAIIRALSDWSAMMSSAEGFALELLLLGAIAVVLRLLVTLAKVPFLQRNEARKQRDSAIADAEKLTAEVERLQSRMPSAISDAIDKKIDDLRRHAIMNGGLDSNFADLFGNMAERLLRGIPEASLRDELYDVFSDWEIYDNPFWKYVYTLWRLAGFTQSVRESTLDGGYVVNVRLTEEGLEAARRIAGGWGLRPDGGRQA